MRESLGVKPEGGMKVNVGVIRKVQHRPDWISLRNTETESGEPSGELKIREVPGVMNRDNGESSLTGI